MAEESKIKPPYVPFGTFKNFAESFRENGLPDVIDRSLMASYSGTVQSTLTTALRSMGFVDAKGFPTPLFKKYVSPTVEDQRTAIKEGLSSCFDVIFSHPTTLQKMTQGQFDNALREEFLLTSSTLDKVASFFLAACAESGIEVGPHLSKRKAVATRRKRATVPAAPTVAPEENVARNEPQANEQSPQKTLKPLQYQLIDLMAEPDFAEEQRQAVWELVQYLAAREKNSPA